jgi:hypothetical protein
MLNQDGPTDDNVHMSTQSENFQLTPIESRDVNQSENVASSDTSEKRAELTLQLIADGTLLRYFARDLAASPTHKQHLYQLQHLEKPETKLLRGGIAIIHGIKDIMAPAKLSERFVNVARRQLKGRQGADKIVLSFREGGHGFDMDADLEESWLQHAFRL